MGISPNTPNPTSLNKLTGLTQQNKDTRTSSKLELGANVVKAQHDLLEKMFAGKPEELQDIKTNLENITEKNLRSGSEDNLGNTINDNQNLIDKKVKEMNQKVTDIYLQSILDETGPDNPSNDGLYD